MEMFDEQKVKERIGDMKKSISLNHLKEAEKYFLNRVSDYGMECGYDIIANESPYFKTYNYTEYAHCLMINPLNIELKVQQMIDARNDNCNIDIDYISFFKNKIIGGTANKYQDMNRDDGGKPRGSVVVLPGSNVLKKRICIAKLKKINDDGDVWFKPHPMTKFGLIGELMDIIGEDAILPRMANLYAFLLEANTVHTSHLSESAMYAVALGKNIDPIDQYHMLSRASFYHVNKFLFASDAPKEWVNIAFNSPKSGIINPLVDKYWKDKIDKYLEYMQDVREKMKNSYIIKTEKDEDEKDSKQEES